MDPQLWYFGIALLAAGALAGYSAGLFGIGGGAIMVPVLFYVFKALGYSDAIVFQCAIATSSAVIIINSLRSVSSHHKHKSVDWDVIWPKNLLRSWGLWIGAGALLASAVLVQYLTSKQLTIIFGAVASLVSLQFIFGRPDWKLREELPRGLGIPVVGGGIGTLSALMGIGGGTLSVSMMVMCGKSIHRAIGTASGLGVFISIPATIGFIYSGWGVAGRPAVSLGYVSVLGFAIIAATTLIFIPLGARTAHKTDQSRLKKVFGIFLLLIALNMIREALFKGSV